MWHCSKRTPRLPGLLVDSKDVDWVAGKTNGTSDGNKDTERQNS